MVILWPDIESGRDLVESDLDGFGNHQTSNLDGFGNHLDLILDARVPSHLDSILDGPILNLANKSSLDSISGHLKLKLDGNAVPSKIKVRWHLDLILDALISSRFDFRCPNIKSRQNYN
jgi:hypothetical protein